MAQTPDVRLALEIQQTWNGLVLDTRHFRKGEVRVGPAIGWRWTFLGVDMGFVPAPLRLVLPYTPPMWSEVHAVSRTHFYADDDDLGTTDHPMFVHDGERWEARPPRGWTVHNGPEAADTAAIPVTDGLEITCGDVTFRARMVPAPARDTARSFGADPPFLATLAGLGMVGALFALAMWTAPPPPITEAVEMPEYWTELVLKTPDKPKPKAVEKKRSPEKAERIARKQSDSKRLGGGKRSKRERKLEEDLAEARSAGLLQAFDAGGVADALDGGLSSDVFSAVDGLVGVKGGRGPAGGMGDRDGSLAGGGDAEGSDSIGPIGDGPGSLGGPGGPPKSAGVLPPSEREVLLIGQLPASEVDRVVKNHLSRIRYCYARALTREGPALSGKVVIKFVIAGDGSVSSAAVKETTLRSPAVEQCVSSQFMKMQFPAPAGKGRVIVSYPFLFTPSS